MCSITGLPSPGIADPDPVRRGNGGLPRRRSAAVKLLKAASSPGQRPRGRLQATMAAAASSSGGGGQQQRRRRRPQPWILVDPAMAATSSGSQRQRRRLRAVTADRSGWGHRRLHRAAAMVFGQWQLAFWAGSSDVAVTGAPAATRAAAAQPCGWPRRLHGTAAASSANSSSEGQRRP